jgi:hypothetical protein
MHSTMCEEHWVHLLVEMKQGQCICPLSWSVHCNFTGEGKCNVRGWACTPHSHQPGLILPSSLNVRQKAAASTLCTLWWGVWGPQGPEVFVLMQKYYAGLVCANSCTITPEACDICTYSIGAFVKMWGNLWNSPFKFYPTSGSVQLCCPLVPSVQSSRWTQLLSRVAWSVLNF